MKLLSLIRRNGAGVGLCLLGLLAGGGCLTAMSTNGGARPTIINPRWEDRAFAAHLDFFYDAFLEGTAPTAQPVDDYVRALMRAAWLQPAVEGRYRLGLSSGRPLGHVGYVAGKHPPVAQEAVLVCANLSGEQTVPETAALLEVARVYGLASQYTLMPERSVIFALWPYAFVQDDALAGLRAYLRQPTWRLGEVQAVIYIGLPVRLREEARALLAEHDIPLYRIGEEADASRKEATRREGTDETPVRASVVRARQLAQRTHERLRATTLTGGKIMPALGDTLRVPPLQ